jgi:hypothetical protein
LEDVRVYRAFERALIGSVDPRSALELALTHWLASLLWRLRRASAIETGLFENQGELLLAARQAPSHGPSQLGMLPTPTRVNGYSKAPGSNRPPATDQELLSRSIRPPLGSNSRAIVQCFLRLSSFDPTLLDRVGGHESRLWRQALCTRRSREWIMIFQMALILLRDEKDTELQRSKPGKSSGTFIN